MNKSTLTFSWGVWASRLLYLLPVLITLAFWPTALLGTEVVKKYLFLLAVLAVLIFYLFDTTRERGWHRLSSWWVVGLFAPPLAALFSSLMSGAARHSLIGLGFESDTFFSLLFFALIAVLVPLIWRTRREIFNFLLLFLSLGSFVLLFQTIKILAGNFTLLAIFAAPAANLLGRWNELGILAGALWVLSVAFLAFLPWRQTKLLGILTISAAVLSVISLIFINYQWPLLIAGIGSLVIWLAKTKITSRSFLNWRSYLSVNLLFSLIFVLLFAFGQPGASGPWLGQKFDWGLTVTNLNNRLGIQTLEVSPSWAGTWSAAKDVLASDPIFGIGPNKFSAQWLKSRPIDVNETPFWGSNFDAGIGVIPTAFSTMGLIGLAAYLLLLAVILIAGWQIWRRRAELEEIVFGLAFSAWLLVVYFWTFNVIYVPGTVLTALTFLFTGLLVAALAEINPARPATFKIAWLSTFGLSGGLVVSLILLALVGQSFWSLLSYNRGFIKAVEGDLTKGERLIASAASLNPNDLYYRSLVDVDVAFMNQLAQNSELSPEEVQQRFQAALSAGIGNGQKATEYNSLNYLNWLTLGRVYETVVPLKVPGAYDEGLKAYNRAKNLGPNTPAIWLSLARLEIAAGNRNKAREYLDQALALKRNYTEAIFVLAQLDSATGNLGRSIRLAEESVKIPPADPVAFFGLGLLKYQASNYAGAREALEQAVALNGSYANARYFLGLSYDQLGERAKALEQFKILLASNNLPELRQIVANLEAGRRALSNTPPPAPEDRTDLPLKTEE